VFEYLLYIRYYKDQSDINLPSQSLQFKREYRIHAQIIKSQGRNSKHHNYISEEIAKIGNTSLNGSLFYVTFTLKETFYLRSMRR
jgi:hypothetical protein